MIWVSWYHFAWQSEIMLSNFITVGVTHSLTRYIFSSVLFEIKTPILTYKNCDLFRPTTQKPEVILEHATSRCQNS
jgi:hypothetical protein